VLHSKSETVPRSTIFVRLALVAGVLLSLAGVSLESALTHKPNTAHATGNFSMPNDSFTNIHLEQDFNYNIPDVSVEAGKADFVWGSDHPTQPAGMYNTYYYPYDRQAGQDWSTNAGATYHDLAWFQANHPDWIEYRCDKTSIAYEYGDAVTPLDITNTSVLNYIFQTYLQPAVARGYAGISFDNVNLDNFAWGPSSGQRCGHYNATGAWVQQFSGSSTDPAYHTAVINWAQWMQSQLHAIGASVTMNFGYDLGSVADSNTLIQYMDIDNDERGFTNWGNSGGNYLTDSAWSTEMQAYMALDSQGKGYISVNQEPEAFANISNTEKQWVIANYLLMKGHHTYLWISGPQEYGSYLSTPEYGVQVGYPLGSSYQSQNVYMRDYSNGLTIVNPSSTQSFGVTLPAGTYQDMYGNAVSNTTLSAHSGLVLVKVSTASASVPTPDHVVVVIDENHAYNEIIGSSAAPYINSLANAGAVFTQSFGVEHPSQPNYLDIFSGANQGITDDSCPHTFSANNLAAQLIATGKTFAGYSEGLPSAGSTTCSSGNYARKHNPWINFSNVPTGDNLLLTSFPSDFTTLPTVSFVIPDLCNDMHDCSVSTGDSWLQSHIDAYKTWAMAHNSLLVTTFDEDDFSTSNQIATVFDGQMVKSGQYPETINHFNILRTIEDMYGLSHLGSAASVGTITDTWNTTTDITPPSVPASPHSTNATSNTISLAWNTSTDNSGGSGVAGYKVYRGNVLAATLAGASNLTYIDAGLNPSTSYSYKVSAYDNSGNESAQSAAVNASTTAVGQTVVSGDCNGDSHVTIIDLSILLSHYGQAYSACDFNTDNTINIFDLSILLSNYGR
jgi:hypothetical protein